MVRDPSKERDRPGLGRVRWVAGPKWPIYDGGRKGTERKIATLWGKASKEEKAPGVAPYGVSFGGDQSEESRAGSKRTKDLWEPVVGCHVRVKYLLDFQFPLLDHYSYSIFHFSVSFQDILC